MFKQIFLILFKHKKNNQKGFILFGAIFLVLFLSIIISSVMMRSEMQLELVDRTLASHDAFYSAETGIDEAIYNLRQDLTWRPELPLVESTLSVDGDTTGFYTIQVADAPPVNSWNSVWVRSDGLDARRDVRRAILARVIVANPSRFLVSSLGNLPIGSGVTIDADILGQDIVFEINESLPDGAREIHMNGDAFYLDSISNENHVDVIWGAGNSAQEAPSITFPGVDASRYSQLAQDLMDEGNGRGYHESGNLNLVLNNLNLLDGDATTYPEIVFVAGDIHVSGTYSESVLIVAGGNIYIDGDVQSTGGPTPPQIGLFADQDVIIPDNGPGDNITVEAFVMADGEGAASGVFVAEGDKYSRGVLNFFGAIAVRGEDGVRSSLNLNAFSTRLYNFDSQLSSNASIPFLPFMANIQSWLEITPLTSMADFPPP